MREDDDAPQGTPDGPLADGLGETAEPGGYSTTSEPYGDLDSYGDSYGDAGYGDDDSTSSEPSGGDDTPTGDGTTPDDGGGADGYGEGETGDDVVIYDGTDVDDDAGNTPVDDGTSGDLGLDDTDLLAESSSPLEGVGFIIDEVREALFGDGDEAATPGLDADLDPDLDAGPEGDDGGVIDA